MSRLDGVGDPLRRVGTSERLCRRVGDAGQLAEDERVVNCVTDSSGGCFCMALVAQSVCTLRAVAADQQALSIVTMRTRSDIAKAHRVASSADLGVDFIFGGRMTSGSVGHGAGVVLAVLLV